MFIAVTTNRAGTGSVSGFNRIHRQFNAPGLVLNHLMELVETPVAKFKPHFSAKAVSSFANSRKVFKSECFTECSRSFDKPAADIVIHPTSKPRLTTTKPLKMSLRGFRTAGLKTAAELSHSPANSTNGRARVLVSFGVGGKLNDAKINTEKAVYFAKRWVFHVADRHKIELTINETKLRLSALSFKKFGLMLSADKGYFLPASDSPDRNHLLIKHVAKDSRIKRDGPLLSEGSEREFIQLVGIGERKAVIRPEPSSPFPGGWISTGGSEDRTA
jgi:hypothetical protein